VPRPEYPRAARRRGEAGTVTIRLNVDERGQVIASIERSSGFPELDASARQAAQSAQCKPYLEGGRPIRVTALQPISFVPAD
jgi:protein TonB